MRPGLIAGLRQAAQTDQAAIAQAVVSAGGAVKRHFWHLSALSVEVPAAAVPVLLRLPRVRSAHPVRARRALDVGDEPIEATRNDVAMVASMPPMENASNFDNHGVARAWNILAGGAPGATYRGAEARVAVFDSGIDADIFDTNSGLGPHPAFLTSGPNPVTRIIAHLQTSWVNKYADCNILTIPLPYVLQPPFTGLTSGYRPTLGVGQPGHNAACGHGTAMAAIAAGTDYPASSGNYPAFPGHGHAPDAQIVDVACASYEGTNASSDWVYPDENYLGAIELLREYILNDGFQVHVANLSLGGEPSPDHPISLALDHLARTEDILLVTAGGNGGDSTRASNGFYHGIAVGAVHARVDETNHRNLSFVPLPQSSRGPLTENVPGRFYPDLCATGGGIGHLDYQGAPQFDYPTRTSSFYSGSWLPLDGCLSMPGIDIADPSSKSSNPPNRVSPLRPAPGTSAASAQVAGAATLYRGSRPSATAEETRAALLLNVIGTYVSQDGQTSQPAAQHTYTGRNTFGVGYLRDDLLAEFAVRDPLFHPKATVVSLTQTAPVSVTNYTGSTGPLTFGDRYAVVICWRRYLDPNGEETALEGPLPNVDLEVWDAATPAVLLARSDSPANSYERVAFLAPASGAVDIRVSTADTGLLVPPLDVQIVARRLPADIDPKASIDHVHAASGSVESVSAGSSCTADDREWGVDRIVPYSWAYGSGPLTVSAGPSWARHAGYDNGFDLGMGRVASHSGLGNYRYRVHVQYTGGQNGVVGPGMTIRGLAFRTWRPLRANDLLVTIQMEEAAWFQPVSPAPANAIYPLPSGAAVTVAGGIPLREIRSPGLAGTLAAATTGREDFAVVVPFDQPFSWTGSGALHMWITVQASAPELLVDGTDDGGGQPIESRVAVYNTGPGTQIYSQVFPGHAPILGLIADTPRQPRELRLVAHGEPFSPWEPPGPASYCSFDVRLYSGLPTPPQPPPIPAILYWGWGPLNPTPVPVPPCSYWLNNPFGFAVDELDAFGMTRFAVPVPSNMVHTEFGLQAVVLPASGPLLTNALHVRVGGGL